MSVIGLTSLQKHRQKLVCLAVLAGKAADLDQLNDGGNQTHL